MIRVGSRGGQSQQIPCPSPARTNARRRTGRRPMIKRAHRLTAWTHVLFLILLVGCSPAQPFFLYEDGDLSHYLDVATEISYPDVDQPPLPDAEHSEEPLSTQDPEVRERWKLTLEEVLSIALNNTQTVRQLGAGAGGGVGADGNDQRTVGGGVGAPDGLTRQPDAPFSIYDPAIQETSAQGVEAALANFDAQLQSTFTWDRTDRPQNSSRSDPSAAIIFANLLEEDDLNYQTELSKRSASGTQWFLRNVTTYNSSNRPLRQEFSEWFTSFEAEVRHPLLRNSGVQVNRIPIILARINTDVALTDFEGTMVNFVSDIEQAYWALYFQYHRLDARRTATASALETWKAINARRESGTEGGGSGDEAQARAQYFSFRGTLEEAQNELFDAESRLRYLMGVAATDGRIIQPVDEPTKAPVEFYWHDVKNEMLVRSLHIRRQKWRIKQRQLQLIAARNQLLPQFDAVALYRFLGSGDDLARLGSRFGPNFPENESLAFDDLTEGRFQEWRLGFQFQMPLGFRNELTTVRNQQLQLRRDEKRLEDVELELTHQLSFAVRHMNDQRQLANTRLNALLGFRDQVEAASAAYFIAQTGPLDLLLDAQARQAQAEEDYFRALAAYNIAIAGVHFRKGSLLEYNGIVLAEGPWPKKGYFDAQARARQRDASYYLDYGFTRPGVISRGPLHPLMNEADAAAPMVDGVVVDNAFDETTSLDSDGPELVGPENVPVPEGDPVYGTLGL